MDLLLEILRGIAMVFVYFWWVIVLVLIIAAWQNKRKARWFEEQESIILKIKIPKTNDKDPTAAEMMFAAIHGILIPKKERILKGVAQEHIGFEIIANHSTIQFYVWVPKKLKDFVAGQIYAQYPTADITECDDYTEKLRDDKFLKEKKFIAAEIELEKEDFLPIKTFNNFHVDPLAGITGVLSELKDKNEEVWIQILTKPTDNSWADKARVKVENIKSGKSSSFLGSSFLKAPLEFIVDLIKIAIVGGVIEPDSGGNKQLSTDTESKIAGIEEKIQKLAYETKIRIVYSASQDNPLAKERIRAIIGAFKQFNTTNLNGFKGKIVGNINRFLKEYSNRVFLGKGFILNIEELASIYHLPHTSVETPNIEWTTYKTGEPPTNLPTLENTDKKDIAIFAKTNFRGRIIDFGVKRDDRRRHMYIVGKSGMGKTKLQELLIEEDIRKGEGVAVIDPHGDLTKNIMAKIPKERENDVIIFDPSDVDFPIGFNPMEVIDEGLKIQTAAGIVATFKKIFGYSWGPRLEYILNYTVLALLDTPDTTLLGIVRMLTDKKYRKKIVDNIKDPVVKKFWTTEFATYNDRFATEAIAPILNKVGQFVANSLIRNVIGQPKSSFSIREIMDKQKIILFNLSTGKVGESNASLMGSLLITALQLAAMSRADIDEEDRKDFYLYIDEFQNFATDSFKNILSEARKYRLNLIIANQYLEQIDDSGVKEAVFGNVGTIITFRVGAKDAEELTKEFNPPFETQDIINLPRQHIYIKMTIDGQSETAFSAKTITIEEKDYKKANVENIINRSRQRFSKPREEVEDEIARNAGINISEFTGMNSNSQSKESVASEIEDSDDENSFVAPIIEEIKDNKNKDKNKGSLSDIIKENTAHVSSKKDSSQKESSKEKAKKKSLNHKNLEKEADYIVRHKDGDHKYVFLKENAPSNIIPDEKGRKKGTVYKKNGEEIYRVKIDMYNLDNSKEKADIWVGSVKEMIDQLEAIASGRGGGTKFLGVEAKNNKNKQKLQEEISRRKGKSSKKLTIKEKIDKETLAKIIEQVVTPSDKKNKDKEKTKPTPKKEKVITAKNFKKISIIHPHEKVKIVEPQELEEGKKIKF